MTSSLLPPSLLPPNATPLELQLEQVMADRLSAIDCPLLTLLDIEQCPDMYLPWLAWQLGVLFWDNAWSDDQKRDACRDASLLHQRAGTRWAIHYVLARIVMGSYQIQCWYELDTQAGTAVSPFTFIVNLDGDHLYSIDDYATILNLIDRVKSLRDQYSVAAHIGTLATTYSAGAVQYGQTCVISSKTGQALEINVTALIIDISDIQFSAVVMLDRALQAGEYIELARNGNVITTFTDHLGAPFDTYNLYGWSQIYSDVSAVIAADLGGTYTARVISDQSQNPWSAPIIITSPELLNVELSITAHTYSTDNDQLQLSLTMELSAPLSDGIWINVIRPNVSNYTVASINMVAGTTQCVLTIDVAYHVQHFAPSTEGLWSATAKLTNFTVSPISNQYSLPAFYTVPPAGQ